MQSSSSSYSWHWPPGVVQHRPGGGFPNQLWLTCVSCQVGRISYKFVIVYRSAIAGGFIKEQNLFFIYFLLLEATVPLRTRSFEFFIATLFATGFFVYSLYRQF